VNYEITRFKQLGRSHAIHYIIIGGDTHPDSPDFCFPHTAITTQSGEVSVPLAADARAQGDGFRDAILKVIAGILDLDFDKLRRRDERRKVRRAMLLATLSFSLTVAFSVITYLAVQAENKAVKQARVATSRSLAASALNLQQREDVAMLMALEALRIDKTSEAKASLMQIVASTPVIRYLRGHARPATAITSTPKYIITGGRDGELFVWHADHYEIIANLSGAHQTRITALASSRDGHLFASADLNGLIIIWRAGDLKQVAAFKHGYGAVWDLDFGPGHVLASGGDDRHVNFWDDKAQWLGGGAFHLGAISVVRFDASGKRLVSAAQDGSFVVWDTYNVKASSIGRDNHAYGIEAADFSDDGNTLITAGDELILWNTSVSPPTMIKEFETRVGVNQIILDNTGGTALLAGETGFVDVYDLSTGQSMALRFKKHRGIVEDFAVLSDLRVVSSARDDVAGAVVWRRPDIRQFPQALFLSTRLPRGVLKRGW
jgi:hypothetical protein